MLMDIGRHYTIITEAILKIRFISCFNGSEIIISTQKLSTLGFLYLNQWLAAGSTLDCIPGRLCLTGMQFG